MPCQGCCRRAPSGTLTAALPAHRWSVTARAWLSALTAVLMFIKICSGRVLHLAIAQMVNGGSSASCCCAACLELNDLPSQTARQDCASACRSSGNETADASAATLQFLQELIAEGRAVASSTLTLQVSTCRELSAAPPCTTWNTSSCHAECMQQDCSCCQDCDAGGKGPD